MDTGRMTPELSLGLVKALNVWAERLLKGDFLLVFEGKGDHCRIGFIRDGKQRTFPAYAVALKPETLTLDEVSGRVYFIQPAIIEAEFEIPADKPTSKTKTKAKKPSK